MEDKDILEEEGDWKDEFGFEDMEDRDED